MEDILGAIIKDASGAPRLRHVKEIATQAKGQWSTSFCIIVSLEQIHCFTGHLLVP